MRRNFWALINCPFALLPTPQFPPHTKPWNPNSVSRASKNVCRIQHIIKKASILQSSLVRLATKPKKSGRSLRVRKISTLPPKPRAEGSSPSAPAIVTGARKRLHYGVCGLFPSQNRPIGHALKIPDFRGKILQTPQFT